jgi:nucleotide-binding universal stress UspA family protein
VPELFNTILWASDGRADDHPVLDYVGELCERHGCELRIVHVVQAIRPEPMPQFDLHGGEVWTIAWLKARSRALRRDGVDASLHVIRGVFGSPAPAIVEFAEAVDADLMVLHPHHRRPIGSVGTAAALLASAPCPLLLLGREFGRFGGPSPTRRHRSAGSRIGARSAAPSSGLGPDHGRRELRIGDA